METITTKFDNFGNLSISENRRYLMEGDKPFLCKYVRGDYKIKLEIKVDGNQIQSEIKNSISSSPSTANKKEKGIGIENLKRRLDLLYPEKYSLDFKQTDHMFIAKLTINTD